MSVYPHRLHTAVLHEDLNAVKRCLHYLNADISCHKFKLTAVHLSYKCNEKTEILDLLLLSGANVNAQNIRGHTPIHYMCFNEDILNRKMVLKIILKKILSHGGDINVVTTMGSTALHLATTKKKFSNGCKFIRRKS